jgi:hypothetical protein
LNFLISIMRNTDYFHGMNGSAKPVTYTLVIHEYSFYRSICLKVSGLMSTKSSSNTVSCEICGLTFNTVSEKEEHVKLEHKEHQPPSGVG